MTQAEKLAAGARILEDLSSQEPQDEEQPTSCAMSRETRTVANIREANAELTLKSEEFVQLIISVAGVTKAKSIKSPAKLVELWAKRKLRPGALNKAILAAYNKAIADGLKKPEKPAKLKKVPAVGETAKKPVGRPKGSKNKPKVAASTYTPQIDLDSIHTLFSPYFAEPEIYGPFQEVRLAA